MCMGSYTEGDTSGAKIPSALSASDRHQLPRTPWLKDGDSSCYKIINLLFGGSVLATSRTILTPNACRHTKVQDHAQFCKHHQFWL